MKGQRLDLNLKTNIGKINVEVNSNNGEYIQYRNMAYLCDMYSHDILVGQEYDGKTKYIQINLSYKLGKNRKALDIYKFKNEAGDIQIDNFIMYVINMDYYMNLWYTKNTKEINKNIVLVMLGLEKEELLDLSKKDRMVLRYMSELDKVNENPEFREYMSYEEDQRKITNSLVSEGRRKEKEQIIKSMLKSGMTMEEVSKIIDLPENENSEYREYMSYEEDERKIRNSIASESLRKGREEGIEQIVYNMLESDMSVEEISKVTKLPIDRVQKIKYKME